MPCIPAEESSLVLFKATSMLQANQRELHHLQLLSILENTSDICLANAEFFTSSSHTSGAVWSGVSWFGVAGPTQGAFFKKWAVQNQERGDQSSQCEQKPNWHVHLGTFCKASHEPHESHHPSRWHHHVSRQMCERMVEAVLHLQTPSESVQFPQICSFK